MAFKGLKALAMAVAFLKLEKRLLRYAMIMIATAFISCLLVFWLDTKCSGEELEERT